MPDESRRTLVLLAVVVLASGCASSGGNQNTESSIISVNTFDAPQGTVPAGQTINLNMELENTGDSEVRNVAARIFGPAWLNTKYSKSERTKSFGTLYPETDSRPGMPKMETWSLNAPDIGENREVDYTIFSKIFYSYSASTTTDFKLVSSERFRDQGYTRTDASLETMSGPIQLDIRGTTPKIYYKEDSNTIESEICIVATNSGSGTAFTSGEMNGREYELSQANKDTIRLSIDARGGVNFEATGDKSGNTVNVPLVSGEEGYQCFTMSTGSLNNDETNVNVQVTAEYNYVKEDQTTTTVEGRAIN
ncbi:MAG: hypothetical protein ABEJ95_06235 [Candidatus Nanohalobium sp.]